MQLLVTTVFLWNLYGFIHMKTCHLQTDVFTFFFSIWMPFIFVSYLTALSTIFNTVMKMEILAWFLILEKMFSVFTIHYDTSYGFQYMVLIMLKQFYCIPSVLDAFIKKGVLNFFKCFSASVGMNLWFLSFVCLMWYITHVEPFLAFQK